MYSKLRTLINLMISKICNTYENDKIKCKGRNVENNNKFITELINLHTSVSGENVV